MRKILTFVCSAWLITTLCPTTDCSSVDGYASQSLCPGVYCGRVYDADTGNHSACGACPRGTRTDPGSQCTFCDFAPTLYDWLYLSFMALLALALHWFFIDFTNAKKIPKLVILHISALVECILAAIATLLVSEPVGSFNLRSCRVKQLSDWYTMFFNPKPDYTTTLHCTQEAVFPLYTVVMIYYAFCLVAMMLVRPVLSKKLVLSRGAKSIYAALYFFPILVVIQAVFGGLIYYSFPYITLVVSAVTSAIYFSHIENQTMKAILLTTFKHPRNLVIVLCHWLMHAFGIIAITELSQPVLHGCLLLLVPFPSVFYVLTVKFSDPAIFENMH